MSHSFAQAQPFRPPKTSEWLVCQNRHEVVHSASRDVFDLLDPVPAQRGHWERPLEPPWRGRWPSVVLLRIHQTARCRVLQLHQVFGHVCRTQGDLYLETLPVSCELHRRVSEWLARARTKERELAGGSSQAGAAWINPWNPKRWVSWRWCLVEDLLNTLLKCAIPRFLGDDIRNQSRCGLTPKNMQLGISNHNSSRFHHVAAILNLYLSATHLYAPLYLGYSGILSGATSNAAGGFRRFFFGDAGARPLMEEMIWCMLVKQW